MRLPIDLVNIINDYYVGMLMHELKQKMHAEFHFNVVIRHLKSFHETTHSNGAFCPSFCLAVLNYMRRHKMFI